MENLLGQGRAAIDLIVDENSFEENALADLELPYEDYGPGAVIGSARISGEVCTVIANDAMTFNPRFPVVYAGVIGLEEGYKWRWRSIARWPWIKTSPSARNVRWC